jgi:signal transduction histidine kinase
LRDITERLRAEAELRLSRQRLQMLSHRLLEVQEVERQHLSRELHDEIGQVLTGLKLALDAALLHPHQETHTRLRDAQALVTDLVTHVRDLSLDLRPSMLDDLGLMPALLWLFERYTTRLHVHVSFEQRGIDRRFLSPVEIAAFRIVQEALTNVARHAGAKRVTVRLWADDSTLGIQVVDDGAGFDPDALVSKGAASGLAGMRERALLLGGQLSIESRPGSGTRLTVELPLEPSEGQAESA